VSNILVDPIGDDSEPFVFSYVADATDRRWRGEGARRVVLVDENQNPGAAAFLTGTFATFLQYLGVRDSAALSWDGDAYHSVAAKKSLGWVTNPGRLT
jgi:hypothetical protein